MLEYTAFAEFIYINTAANFIYIAFGIAYEYVNFTVNYCLYMMIIALSMFHVCWSIFFSTFVA